MTSSAFDDLIATTQNIYCVGRNYAAHAAELNNAVPDEPIIFAKNLSCLSWGDALQFPKALQPIHHELELVLRIGRDLPLDGQPTMDDISHMGIGIDFTARKLQSDLKAKGLPWHLSKNFQHSAYVAGLAESQALPIRFELQRDQDILQSGNTEMMLFSFELLLAFLCRFTGLKTGDLIFTGTPSGVAPVEENAQYQLRCEQLGIQQDLSFKFI